MDDGARIRRILILNVVTNQARPHALIDAFGYVLLLIIKLQLYKSLLLEKAEDPPVSVATNLFEF